MNFERILNYKTEDFILDDFFIKWVLHPDKESDIFWIEFISTYPEKKELVENAVFILKSAQPVEPEISEENLSRILEQLNRIYSLQRSIIFPALKIAAAFLLLISIGGLIYYSIGEKYRLPFETASDESLQKGKLIFADGTVREFETEQTRIHQVSEEEIIVNNDTIAKDAFALKADKTAMNQIIIPYGKRSEITLADGTHIWLNSGSQLSYPAAFSPDSREVYLSGEAFFDVQTDHSRPFYVITKDLKLKVLGTRFNVSSYENDFNAHAVLEAGKISASRNKKFTRSIELIPGERILFNKTDEIFSKELVDVSLFSSWKNGYLIFKSESLSEIFRKLERYYNCSIILEKNIENKTFSGKLDLKEELEQVLQTISFTSDFSVSKEKNTYFIKP